MSKHNKSRVTVHQSARSRIGAVKVVAFRWVMEKYGLFDPYITIRSQGLEHGSPHNCPHFTGSRVHAFMDSGSKGRTH